MQSERQSKKNIYLSAMAGNRYVDEYTENVLSKVGSNTDVFFLSCPCDGETYKKPGIHFLSPKTDKRKGIRSITYGWMLSLTKECRDNRPDIFLVHNANPWTIVKYYPLWRRAKRRILIFWGTDINEISKRNARVLKLFLSTVTDMGFTSETLRQVFLKRFGEKNISKTHITIFGMPLYNELRTICVNEKASIIDKKNKYKNAYLVPEGKLAIHVGYNAPEAQQHINIINAIGRLPAEIKEKLYVMIPFGYGRCRAEYKKEVENAIKKAGLDGCLLTEYYDKAATAALRNACDIFIYGRTMDSHSFTPAEYMYAGARVIMPKWLLANYKEITAVRDYKIYVYNDFDGLTDILNNTIADIDTRCTHEPCGIESFRKWVGNTYSWEKSAEAWLDLLE